ncbi:MAG TPA: carboxypeptidase M32 [Solirubrobacteraceae bacterium]|nr:carboxypeptidase M32 [Solirubrobacteraceae bacterium]
MSALENLRARLAELADLESLARLAEWDQLVMMPSGGAGARALQSATLARLHHERSTAPEIGEWLGELGGEPLDELEADIVRIARRDWERARRVPSELAAAGAQAAAEGQQTWQRARSEDDFAAFAPALERCVELARERGACLAEDGQSPYEGLLGEFDFGLRADDLRSLFGSLAEGLGPLIEPAERHSPPRALAIGVAVQEAVVRSVLARVGVDRESWRVDVSTHPFTSWCAPRDTRLTTRYRDGDVESLLSSLHEYGHGLYERQVDPALTRTTLGAGTSMSIHESQSKLWENHVARSPAFAEVLAADVTAAGLAVTAEELRASLVGVQRSLIRVSADPLTYPLHIIVRFELELALIGGDLAVADLPAAWREQMRARLAVEVPSDALGCLQDVHWSAGAFGYFPSYALGCLIAAQMWEAMEAEIGPLEDALREARVAPLQEWLGERVHRPGRRVDTMPLVQSATGRPLEVAPFLRYVAPLAGP